MAENVGAISYLVEIDTKNFTAQLKSVDGAVQSVAKSSSSHFSNFASNASSAFDGVASSIASLAKVAGAALLGGTFGGKVFVDAASQLQSLRASFESLTGSVEETNSVMGTLYKYGLQTAFKNESIQQTAKMFLANGVAVKDLMGWMQQLGDVAGATGADLTMLALPLTQAIGKGKLQTQDWYQIINQGAGGLQKYIVAALGAGHSTKTFQDDLANGAVTADVLRKALQMASAEGGMAFRGAIKQAETFNGRMSNLMEGVTNVGLAVLGVDAATGRVKAGGVFDNLSKAVQQATEWLTDNKEQITAIAKIVIDNAIPAIAGIAAAFVVAKVAAIGFGVAAGIAAGTISVPFLLAATAISAVAAAITFLQVKFGLFTPVLQFFSGLWDNVVTVFNQFLLPILRVVWDFIANQLTSAILNIQQAIEPWSEQLKILGIIIGVAVISPIIVAIGVLAGFISIVGVVVSVIANVISWFINMGSQVTAAFWKIVGAVGQFAAAVSSGTQSAKNAFSNMLSDIGKIVTGAIGSMYNSGKALITGFANGIRDAFEGAKKVAKDGLEAVKRFFPHSPAKEGPFSGRGYTTYSGAALMRGFADGMASQQGLLQNTAGGTLSGVLGTFDNLTSPTLGIDGSGSLSGSVGSRTANITNNYVVNNQADAEIISRKQAYAMGAV
jgi:tape measure domain-containing protein